MTRHFVQIRTILFLAVSLGATIILSTGCRSMGLAATQPLQPAIHEPTPISATVESDAKADDKLKALESFLARTEAYSLAPAGAAAPTPEVSRLTSPVEPAPKPLHGQPAALPGYGNPTTTASSSLPRVVFASIAEPLSAKPVSAKPAGPHANDALAVATRSAQDNPTAAPVVKLISIRSNKYNDAVMSASPSAIRVNQPGSNSSDVATRSMDAMLEKLVERAVSKQDVSAAWEAGLIHAALRKPLDAGSLSHALSNNLKPLFLTTIDMVRSLRKMVAENSADVGDTLDQLEALRRMIANRADPSVDAIAMCRQVTTFGVFEEMSMTEFVTGRATPTIVYSELKNLSAQQDANGSYRTELATRIEIFTAQGQSVLSREEPKIIDHCRRHRRDFFIAQRITLPATMQPGDYVLKVFVEDKLAGRASEGSYPFAVGMRTASIRIR